MPPAIVTDEVSLAVSVPLPVKLLKDDGTPARSRVAPASISTEFHVDDKKAKPSSIFAKTNSPSRMSRSSGVPPESWKEDPPQ